MISELKKTAQGRMTKTLDSLRNELAKIRTGRAHASLLDHVHVNYYGSEVPLKQVASVVAEDARTLVVTPYERNLVAAIEKAIMASDLGLNPATMGTVIRVPMPMLTEARRRELVKVIKHEAENAKVALRNVRRDANTELKQALKDKKLAEDEERRGQDDIQKLTDQHIAKVEEMLAAKEKEILTV